MADPSPFHRPAAQVVVPKPAPMLAENHGSRTTAPSTSPGQQAGDASIALISLARALGRQAARQAPTRRAHSLPEVALLLFLAGAMLAAVLALGAR